jgi:hypothetical protein
MGSGFLIRGQVPSLREKYLRKNLRWFKGIPPGTAGFRLSDKA